MENSVWGPGSVGEEFTFKYFYFQFTRDWQFQASHVDVAGSPNTGNLIN
jgi:outer membrane receptor for Fe3+-dicitrate